MSVMRNAVVVGLVAVAVPLSGHAKGGGGSGHAMGGRSGHAAGGSVAYYYECGIVSESNAEDRNLMMAAYQHVQLLSEVDHEVVCWQQQKESLEHAAILYNASDVIQHMESLHLDQDVDQDLE
jgi:hypothetical protein